MGNKFLEVVCDEHGIGGSGEYIPRAVLFNFEPGVIDTVTLSRCSASSSARKTS